MIETANTFLLFPEMISAEKMLNILTGRTDDVYVYTMLANVAYHVDLF